MVDAYLQQNAAQPTQSHARGRGIRHLAEHGSIATPAGVVNSPYEWESSTPSRPPQELQRSAISSGSTSANAPVTHIAEQPWAGLQSPRVRVSGIFDTNGETWRSPDAPEQPLKRGPSHPTVASGLTLTPGSLVPNPRTAPIAQNLDSARTAGMETLGTSAATAFEGSSVRPRGIRASYDPPDCDTAGTRSSATAMQNNPPAGGKPASMSSVMWWQTAPRTVPGSAPAGTSPGTSLF